MKETVQVTRDDREAAAKLYEWFHALSSSRDAALKSAQFVRTGGGDGWNTVQLFARHRIAALSAAPAPSGQEVAGEVERIRAAVEKREAGVRADALHRKRSGYPMNEETLAKDRSHATVAGVRLDDLQALLAYASKAAPAPSCVTATTPPASGVTVPEGMKAWHGGESAPVDWDGNRVLGDDDEYYEPFDDGGLDWQHGLSARGIGADIIAYTPKPAALSTPSATPGEEAKRFWLIVHEPGMVPERKGSWPAKDTAKVLREFIAARPTAYLHVLTTGCDGLPDVRHGPEVLQMLDGRSVNTGRKHNARTLAAHTATATSGALDPATVERCAQIVRECGPQSPEHDWTEHARIRAHMRDRILNEFALATDPHQHGGKGA